MNSVFDIQLWRAAAGHALRQFAEATLIFLPKLFGALLIIVVGWGVSRLCAALSRRALARLGFDQLVARLGLTDSLRGLLRGRAMSEVLSRLLFWVLFVAFLLFAADTLGIRTITAATQRVLLYLPRVFGAVMIVVLSLVLGRLTRSLVASGAALGSLDHAPRVAAVANAVVVLTGGILAIEQLGVSTEILVSVSTVLVGALGLAMGAAFALGARGVIGHVLAGHFLRQRLPAGEEVEVDGIRGVVEVVGPVDTLLRDGDDQYSIPNGMLLDQTVKR